MDAALTLAAHHPPGVRALLIPGYPRRTPALRALFATSKLQPLEELVIRPAESFAADEEPAYALSAARHPHLRVLELAGVAIPRNPAFFAHLRVLALHEHCCATHAFAVPDLLDALAAAAGALEELDLDRFAPHLPAPAQAAAPAAALEQRPLIHLARLRSLHVHTSTAVIVPLLRVLRFPTDAVVDVRAAVDPMDAAHLGKQLLPAFVPPDARDTLEAADALLLAFHHDRFALTVRPRAPARSSLASALSSAPAREDAAAPHAQFALALHGLAWELAPRPAALALTAEQSMRRAGALLSRRSSCTSTFQRPCDGHTRRVLFGTCSTPTARATFGRARTVDLKEPGSCWAHVPGL